MRSVSSLPTIEQLNAQKLLRDLRTFDADLYHFQLARLETNIPPTIAATIYREIENIVNGSGYGKVTISVQNGIVKHIEGERSHKVEQEVNLGDGIYVTSEFVSVVETKNA